jgi:pilus assembly protein CpaF
MRQEARQSGPALEQVNITTELTEMPEQLPSARSPRERTGVLPAVNRPVADLAAALFAPRRDPPTPTPAPLVAPEEADEAQPGKELVPQGEQAEPARISRGETLSAVRPGPIPSTAPRATPVERERALVQVGPGQFRDLTKAEQEALAWIRAWLEQELARAGSPLAQMSLDEQLYAGILHYNAAPRAEEYGPLFTADFVPLLRAHYTGWRQLDPLARRADVTALFVNGPHAIYLEAGGVSQRVGEGLSEEEIAALVNKLTGQQLTQGTPIVEARTSDGSRLSALHASVAGGSSSLAFRRYPRRLSLAELVQAQMLTPLAAQFLRDAVLVGLSILISGGTGSGKTTLLQALIDCLPRQTRLGLVEQRPELRPQGDNFVQLHAQPLTIEGNRDLPLSALVHALLWQQPDRVVVGECRGSEALGWLRAANSGHRGCMTTIHANQGVQSAFWVLEGMVSEANAHLSETQIRRRIATGIQLVLHAKKLAGGRRVITEIAQVIPSPGSAAQFASAPLFLADAARDYLLARSEHALDRALAELFELEGLDPDPWRRPGSKEGVH